jgi:hypothetical protein
MGRLELVRQDDKVTVLKGLLTPFGSPSKTDLSGEFFDENTWFGDEYGITTKFAIYDHAINELQNPYSDGAPPNPVLGVCKFVEKDARGRWFEFEIERANEYHDYVMALHAMNRLGASSRTLPGKGVKVMDPEVKGRIAKWPEVEGTLTPTPCESDTAFTEEDYAAVVGAMKTYAPDLYKAAVLKAMADAAAEEAKKAEEVTEPVQEEAPVSEVNPLDAAVEQLKADPVSEIEESEEEDVDPAIIVELQGQIADLTARLAASEAVAVEIKSLAASVATLQQHLTVVTGEATTLKKELHTLKNATRAGVLKGLSAQEIAALGGAPQPKGYKPAASEDAKSYKRPVLKSAFSDNPDAPGS